MGFFDYLQSAGTTAIRSQGPTIRKELVKTKKPLHRRSTLQPPAPAVTRLAPRSCQVRRSETKSRTASPKQRSSDSPSLREPPRRRKITPLASRLSSSSEDDSDDEASQHPPKRLRSTSANKERNINRRLRADVAPKKQADSKSKLVHAADIASLKNSTKYAAAFEGSSDDLDISLQYPSSGLRERFQLVRPRDKDDFDPISEILGVTELVPKFYMSDSQADRFLNENTGIHRKLKRAVARGSCKELHEAVDEYNEAVKQCLDQGTIAENLNKIHDLPLPVVEQILTQIYARTVSPRVDSLRKYENGTDNVYGELLPRFVSKIFEETGLTADKIFVDLGSGVGNVVLQAALEIGCESWGCEVMENACELASLQEREFQSRCELWGLATGGVHLERGDFLTNPSIARALQRADLVLVNNQAFTPELNDRLTNLFLDLKDGCQIVSLKSFVPHDHKITSRNINSPVNLLDVGMRMYYSNCVSWTNAPGTYFVARKDTARLKEFLGRKRK